MDTKKKRTVMAVFGTRPEAIKMCPLVNELKRREALRTLVCVTAQHRQMLDRALETFGVVPDFDLDVMTHGQTLKDVTEKVLRGVSTLLELEKADLVLVHGDTTTAFAASLAAFYEKIPVGHVEAGLRTYDLSAPFPEEFNRQAIGLTAKLHFAPTALAARNLLDEGADPNSVFITGNTVVDALKTTLRHNFEIPDAARGKKLIFLTAHRRENQGAPMRAILGTVRKIADDFKDVAIICPVHKNREVEKTVTALLGGHERIILCPPLETADCHNLLARSYIVLTDSGGIQEETTALGIPTLVLRESTERPEGVSAGVLKIVGSAPETIYREAKRLLESPQAHADMSKSANVYGDGNASRAIADVIEKFI